MLIDATVLVYALDELSEYHRASFYVLEAAVERRLEAYLVPQVLLECYSVVTSTRRGHQGLRPNELLAEFDTWRAGIPVLDVKPEALDELIRLAATTGREGGRIYDLFLVAQMRSHHIREICTVNLKDFQLPGITASLPETVMRRRL